MSDHVKMSEWKQNEFMPILCQTAKEIVLIVSWNYTLYEYKIEHIKHVKFHYQQYSISNIKWYINIPNIIYFILYIYYIWDIVYTPI